jgi:hypothetical protein
VNRAGAVLTGHAGGVAGGAADWANAFKESINKIPQRAIHLVTCIEAFSMTYFESCFHEEDILLKQSSIRQNPSQHMNGKVRNGKHSI